MNELISVIVPVYNVEQYLNQCVESLVHQDYRNIEIILIDDGSTDKSGELCEKWSLKDARVKVVHTENHGLSAARNVGINKTNGKYIYFIDSDDWVEEDILSTLLQNIQIYGADLSSCAMKKDFGEKSHNLHKTEKCVKVLQRRMFHEILCNESVYGYVCNKLFKRDLLKDLLFDEDLLSQEDMDFTMRYLEKCKVCVYTKAEYYHYRQRIESMTGEIGYSSRKLSVAKVYERAISIYETYCPEDVHIVERNYLKININIVGRMQVSNYKNKEVEEWLNGNIKQYYKRVLREKKTPVGVKANIVASYHFPKMMLKLKQRLIAKRRSV